MIVKVVVIEETVIFLFPCPRLLGLSPFDEVIGVLLDF